MTKTNDLLDAIPRTLDEVITKDRDKVTLRLATEQELEALQATYPEWEVEIKNIPPKKVLKSWYPITFEISGTVHTFILSHVEHDNGGWMTSKVIHLASDLSGVGTRSGSFYTLKDQGEGEPPVELLLVLCWGLWEWGLGKSLGIPYIITE